MILFLAFTKNLDVRTANFEFLNDYLIFKRQYRVKNLSFVSKSYKSNFFEMGKIIENNSKIKPS